MEALFQSVLEKHGKNTVEDIMKWLNKARLAITPAQQTKAKEALNTAAQNGKVEFSKFQEVVVNCAKEQKISSEVATKQLTEAAADSVTADASAAAQTAVSGAAGSAKKALGGLFK